eukprot:Opistho-2@41011
MMAHTRHAPLLVVAVAVVVAVVGYCDAYSLNDHTAIMQLAIREFNECYSTPTFNISESDSSLMVRNDLEEDVNVVGKWLYKFSHFYNPRKPEIKICTADLYCRYNSSIRIMGLQDDIAKLIEKKDAKLSEFLDPLAHAAHHIQDMASPPHVVPVMHGLTDGYENYVSAEALQPSARCSHSGVPSSLIEILDATALATLDAIASRDCVYTVNGTHTISDWSKFWQEGVDGESFGDYGAFGNNVGSAAFTSRDGPVVVDAAVYAGFKATRMRAAVDATIQALRWLQGTPQVTDE